MKDWQKADILFCVILALYRDRLLEKKCEYCHKKSHKMSLVSVGQRSKFSRPVYLYWHILWYIICIMLVLLAIIKLYTVKDNNTVKDNWC